MKILAKTSKMIKMIIMIHNSKLKYWTSCNKKDKVPRKINKKIESIPPIDSPSSMRKSTTNIWRCSINFSQLVPMVPKYYSVNQASIDNKVILHWKAFQLLKGIAEIAKNSVEKVLINWIKVFKKFLIWYILDFYYFSSKNP
jgi:hypothetical protein